METNELKHIWKTLADKNLVEKELAGENIQRILANRSSGILSKFDKIFNRDIMITWILMGFLVGILIFLYFFSQTHPTDPKAPFFILAVFIYFMYKQYRDISKKRLITKFFNTKSIRDSLLQVKESMQKALKLDSWYGIVFLMAANAFAIFVYSKWVGSFNEIDFTRIYLNSMVFYMLILMILFFISAPWTLRYFGKRKFARVFQDIENMLAELNEEANGA
jgi:hypothetical protein